MESHCLGNCRLRIARAGVPGGGQPAAAALSIPGPSALQRPLPIPGGPGTLCATLLSLPWGTGADGQQRRRDAPRSRELPERTMPRVPRSTPGTRPFGRRHVWGEPPSPRRPEAPLSYLSPRERPCGPCALGLF